MTSILFSLAERPSSQALNVSLQGVSWKTFQALVAELEPDGDRTLAYDAEQLNIVHHGIDSGNRITLQNLSWQTYQALVADVGDNRAWRIAYSQGVLEIRVPRSEHEEPKEILSDFITVIVDELEVELRKLGALTLERADLAQAVEPDACFYIQSEAAIRGQQQIRLITDPPPDLVIESDYTNSSLNKHSIYAALGVPEIWRYYRQQLEVYVLVGQNYVRAEKSVAFPFLPIDEVSSLVEQSQTVGQRKTVRQFRQRLQEILSNS